MKTALRVLVLALVSAAALVLAWGQVPLLDLASDLERISQLPLVLGWLVLAATMWAKVERWAWLLDAQGHLARRSLWTALLIGYLGNVVLPGRMGELVRAGVLSQKAPVSASQALSSIIVEKVLDVGVLLIFLMVLDLAVPLPEWAAWAGVIGGIVFLGLCAALITVVWAGARLVDWAEFLRGVSPRRLREGPWWHWLADFIVGFSPLRSPPVALRVLFWTFLSCVLGGLVNVCVLWGFGITPLLPAGVLTLVATNLGMALPSAPGYIGVHHYLSTLALEAFNVPHDVAFAYAVVVHALIFGSFALAGALVLMFTGITFGQARGITESENP